MRSALESVQAKFSFNGDFLSRQFPFNDAANRTYPRGHESGACIVKIAGIPNAHAHAHTHTVFLSQSAEKLRGKPYQN